MSPLRPALLALAVAPALAGEARAAAWTLEPGAGFASITLSSYEPERAGTPSETQVQIYAEYGAAARLTLGGFVEFKADRDAPPDVDALAVSAGAFLRVKLHEGRAGDPLSFQFGLIGAPSEPDPATGIFGEETAVDARLLYGRGFGSAWGDVFVNAEGGIRWLLDGGADELRVDLTAGWRPGAQWLLLVQSFATIGLRNPDPFGSDYDSLKLAPAVGYRMGPATVLFGVEQTVTGRNVDRGTRFKLSVWRPF